MAVLNDIDRFHLMADVADRVDKLSPEAAYIKQFVHGKLVEHREYIHREGQDLPEIREWRWEG